MTDQRSLAGLSDLIGTLTPNPPSEVDAALRQITTHAHDNNDARLLAAMLGIGRP